MTRCMRHWTTPPRMWKKVPFSTASVPGRLALWEAGDSGGTATLPLTCGDVGFSTIHSPYYCS
jgi:hypothetical protein